MQHCKAKTENEYSKRKSHFPFDGSKKHKNKIITLKSHFFQFSLTLGRDLEEKKNSKQQKMKVSELPIEILIRIGHILIWERYRAEETFDSIELTVRKEAKWSWKNFLSVSNIQQWKFIRQNAMIWCLNAYESKKYLEDDLFFKCLNHGTSKSAVAVTFSFSSTVAT
jgi:hypothetical protein